MSPFENAVLKYIEEVTLLLEQLTFEVKFLQKRVSLLENDLPRKIDA